MNDMNRHPRWRGDAWHQVGKEAQFSLVEDPGKKRGGGAHSQTVSQFHLVIMQPNLLGILQLMNGCFAHGSEVISRWRCLCRDTA